MAQSFGEEPARGLPAHLASDQQARHEPSRLDDPARAFEFL